MFLMGPKGILNWWHKKGSIITKLFMRIIPLITFTKHLKSLFEPVSVSGICSENDETMKRWSTSNLLLSVRNRHSICLFSLKFYLDFAFLIIYFACVSVAGFKWFVRTASLIWFRFSLFCPPLDCDSDSLSIHHDQKYIRTFWFHNRCVFVYFRSQKLRFMVFVDVFI